MSNPTFSSGQLTREVAEPIEQFRLVVEDGGKIKRAGASAFPFGVVTEAAAPKQDSPAPNAVLLGLPTKVRVGTTQCVARVETAGTIAQGAVVYAAADGKVSASGSVKVGLADKATEGTLTRVNLFHPAALAG